MKKRVLINSPRTARDPKLDAIVSFLNFLIKLDAGVEYTDFNVGRWMRCIYPGNKII